MNNSRFRICVDARLLGKSGIGRYLSEILPSFAEHFDLHCLIEPDGIPFMQKYKIEYSILDAKIYSIKEQFLLPKVVPVCDLFWSPHFNIPIFPIKARKRLVTIHDAFHLAFSKSLSYIEQVYAKIFFNAALARSDKVITVSNFSKSELLKYTNLKFDNKIDVILNGVTKFPIEANSIKPLTKDFFLYVGNIKPHKNLKNAIQAYKLFCQRHPDTFLRFKIVGKKDGFINGDTEVEKLLFDDPDLQSRIDFTGFVEDHELRGLYQNAYCLIFPSIYEGFGLPPLESLNMGTPAIVSNVASMPELCGNAVLYFNPQNFNDICNAMENIVFDNGLYIGLIKKSVLVLQKYNWQQCSDQHVTLINKILSN